MVKKVTKKLKISIIVVFVIFVIVGLSFILYPFMTNVISRIEQNNILNNWSSISSSSFSISSSIDASENLEPGISKETNESNSTQDNKERKIDKTVDTSFSTQDYSESQSKNSYEADNGIKKESNSEIPNNEILTAEDFFPAKISIPKIELEWIVNEGTDTKTLKKGPGHITETPLPGQVGRCTISGHRTTYGAPFNKIDLLEPGDLICLETNKGLLFTYVVTGKEVVKPTDVYILKGQEKKELLLTACEPKFSAINRLVIISELINIYPIENDFE